MSREAVFQQEDLGSNSRVGEYLLLLSTNILKDLQVKKMIHSVFLLDKAEGSGASVPVLKPCPRTTAKFSSHHASPEGWPLSLR